MEAAFEKHRAFVNAVTKGDEAAVQEAIASGHDVNEKGNGPMEYEAHFGWTALHWAIYKKRGEIVKLLVAAGADVNVATNIRDSSPGTPLCFGLHFESTDITQTLLEARANIDGGLRRGTVLHLVAAGNSLETVEIAKLLLEADVDPRTRDWDGQTPADRALERQNKEMAALLRGAEEEWSRSLVLQVSANGAELTFHKMGGDIAASLNWESERPVEEMPSAVLEAIQRSGFQSPLVPLRVSNLKLVLPNKTVLNTAPGGALLQEQMAAI